MSEKKQLKEEQLDKISGGRATNAYETNTLYDKVTNTCQKGEAPDTKLDDELKDNS